RIVSSALTSVISQLIPYTTLFRSQRARTKLRRSGLAWEEIYVDAAGNRLNSLTPGELSGRMGTVIAQRPTPQIESLVAGGQVDRSEEHTSELQSRENLVCRLLLEK